MLTELPKFHCNKIYLNVLLRIKHGFCRAENLSNYTLQRVKNSVSKWHLKEEVETLLGAIPSTNTGWAENGLREALRRRTWGCWLMRSSTWPSNRCSQPRRQTISWAAPKAGWPAGQGRGFCTSALLSWDPTWSPAFSSGALSTGKTWTWQSTES